jgi:ribosomal protein L29
MKKNDRQKLRKMSLSKLVLELENKQNEVNDVRIKLGLNQLKDTNSLSRLLDDVAIIKTIIREKELAKTENKNEK